MTISTHNYNEIEACRLCKHTGLRAILDLGTMAMTGQFPSPGEVVDRGPLGLVICESCFLVQLKQTYDPAVMYGENYGYRSGLNRSMMTHIYNKVHQLMQLVNLDSREIILDIGSNDGLTLSFYDPRHSLIGIDPSGAKFKRFYRADIKLIPDFFSARAFRGEFGGKKAKIVTSIAMLYDLEDPIAFATDVADILHPEGIWHIEQSYLPAMVSQTAYDTICHEHLEYYSLHQIAYIADRVGLRIVDVGQNDINGGSFWVTLAHKDSTYNENRENIDAMLQEELSLGLHGVQYYDTFRKAVETHKAQLVELIHQLNSKGALVCGYGASTKGNVVLQYCGFTAADIQYFAEVNSDKYGRFTPGSEIPIESEGFVKNLRPDYLLVMPWHFRPSILEREAEYMKGGGKMIFPLPTIEIFG